MPTPAESFAPATSAQLIRFDDIAGVADGTYHQAKVPAGVETPKIKHRDFEHHNLKIDELVENRYRSDDVLTIKVSQVRLQILETYTFAV